MHGTHQHRLTYVRTNERMRNKSKAKASGTHVKHSYYRPANQHWDACALLRHLSLVQANSPGAGLVSNPQGGCPETERSRTQSSTTASTPLSEARTVEYLLPQINTRYPLMLQLGELLSQLTTGH